MFALLRAHSFVKHLKSAKRLRTWSEGQKQRRCEAWYIHQKDWSMGLKLTEDKFFWEYNEIIHLNLKRWGLECCFRLSFKHSLWILTCTCDSALLNNVCPKSILSKDYFCHTILLTGIGVWKCFFSWCIDRGFLYSKYYINWESLCQKFLI